MLGYHTITDVWFETGENAQQFCNDSCDSLEGGVFYWRAGEIKPRSRTPEIWRISAQRTAKTFGWGNLTAIVLYLLVLVGIGVYFSFRNQSTEDFFRGGQRIPWWAAGCSIFATMLSSITFMSIPAKTYATDWLYFLLNMSIIALAPGIIHFILPFFRRIDATSAYQYLELRFNLAARLFRSLSYIFFNWGRMGNRDVFAFTGPWPAVTPISLENEHPAHGKD